MANRIPPSEKIRKEINEIFQGMISGNLEGKGLYELLMQKAKLLIAQEALEKEVKEFLGGDYYERDKFKSERKGWRNGYEPKKLRTAEGNLILEIPQVRGGEEKFNSKLKQFFKNNPDVLERLAVEMYVRGLSLRGYRTSFLSIYKENVFYLNPVS